jgi:o-succinylbenzoate---CoA ligase
MIAQAQEILAQWQSGQHNFPLTTSGSTGDPMSISHQRSALQWSANNTLQAWFDPVQPPVQLCVLPLTKAGGFMQIIRAAVWQTPIWVLPPQANPLLDLSTATLLHPNGSIQSLEEAWATIPPTTVSLTPMQIAMVMENPATAECLNLFSVVLLGGQALSVQTENRLIQDYPHTRFIHTFGTTETASHFAGREITPGNLDYCIAPDTQIQTNENGELMVCNPTTKNLWLTLHDKVQIIAPNRFRWLQRSNLYINTGGIKVAIEPLEESIAQQLHWPLYSFYCAGKSHPVYGEQITLFTTHQTPSHIIQQSLSHLPSLQQPKEIIRVKTIATLPSGKIYRNPNP